MGVHAARGWGLAYQASPINLPHNSHTLNLAFKASGARRIPAIQLIFKDLSAVCFSLFEKATYQENGAINYTTVESYQI